MRKIQSKKTKTILKKFAEDELVEEPLQTNEVTKQATIAPRRKKLSMQAVMHAILQTKTKQTNPILAHNTGPLQKLKNQKEIQQQLQLKKKIKKQLFNQGHVDPALHNNKLRERELKVICAKGIMKVFQALRNLQQKTDTK